MQQKFPGPFTVIFENKILETCLEEKFETFHIRKLPAHTLCYSYYVAT